MSDQEKPGPGRSPGRRIIPLKPVSRPVVESLVKDARPRNRRGEFSASGLGESVELRERKVKVRDYRKFLESIEPAAFQVMARGLRDGKVPMKDRILIAQDVLNRLHGRVLQPQEAEEAKRRVENMSTDELRSYVLGLLGEAGLARRVVEPVNLSASSEESKRVVN